MYSATIFAEKHKELVVVHEHISTLVEQMSSDEYSSVSVYLNNLEHLKANFDEVLAIFKLTGFGEWLKETDRELFISITTLQRSFILLGNMMKNMQRFYLL